jgi:thiamine-monophosphate kinase
MSYDEFSLIRTLTERGQTPETMPSADVLVGIGDDAALMKWTDDCHMIMTCDTMVEHIHFASHTMSAHAVGYKALASTISDIAAMGGTPKFVTISLVIPRHQSQTWLSECYDGLYDCAARFGVSIVGGDTVATNGDLSISVTAVGAIANTRKPLTRAAAQVGDLVFVTDCVGLSTAGLDALQHRSKPNSDAEREWLDQLIRAHQYPQPQIKAGQIMASVDGVHALNDISDGLASEAWEIVEASQIGMDLISENLPIHPALAWYASERAAELLGWMLYGGEDYQLVGTVAPADWPELKRRCAAEGIDLYVIGTMSDVHQSVKMTDGNGSTQIIEKKGYNHFADGAE